MLEEIQTVDRCIIYSCYIKKNAKFNQIVKESVYITLLSKILSNIESEIDVVFDRFGKSDFETRIIESTKLNKNILSIKPKDSQLVSGLQFADNICSVIRLNKSSEDKFDYYNFIENMVIEV